GLIPLHVESLSGYRVAMQQPFHILEKISVDLPRVEITPEVLHRTKPYVLADPTFHKPGPIDLLIGSALFPQVLTNERHTLGFNMPFAMGTVFGYVIIGSAPCSPSAAGAANIAISLLSTSDIDLHSSLQKFWTQEELPPCNKKTAEELACDQFF
ncbi:hypothetical protein, partial [Klebsiella pneumoniae]|uniref:hypothetical protein n=1 Tax=Klebsiella pneumoniae TaxID=573 RepID=UPI00117AD9EC